MKTKEIFVGILLAIIFVFSSQAQQDDLNAEKSPYSELKPPVLEGPYLGQEPTGMIPVVFASGILSDDKIRAFCSVFSPDGKYFFFNRRNAATEESNIYWVDAKIIEELKPDEKEKGVK